MIQIRRLASFGILFGILAFFGSLFAPYASATPWVKCSDNSRPRFSSQRGGTVIYTCAPAVPRLGADDGASGGRNFFDLGVVCANGNIKQNFTAEGNSDVTSRCNTPGDAAGSGTVQRYLEQPRRWNSTADDGARPGTGDSGGGGGSGDSTASFGGPCELDQSKFGIPTWYKYLQGQYDPAGNCRLMTQFSTARLNSLLSIGLAIVEILLFAAGIVAVVFIVVGGFRYVLSQGKPEETAKAQESIINSVIGLVIAILAATLVRFIASRLSR